MRETPTLLYSGEKGEKDKAKLTKTPVTWMCLDIFATLQDPCVCAGVSSDDA